MSVKKLHSTAIIQLLTGSAKFSEVSKTVFAMPIGVIIVVCFLQKNPTGVHMSVHFLHTRFIVMCFIIFFKIIFFLKIF